jgi:hypothetical protein
MPDGKGRIRALREHGLVSQRGHGRGAARATSRDASVFLLGCLVTEGWKDAPAAVTRYGNLILSNVGYNPDLLADRGLPAGFAGCSVLEALDLCIEWLNGDVCIEELNGFKLHTVRVKRSASNPSAMISFARSSDGKPEVISLFFSDPNQPDLFSITAEMRGHAVTVMADLLANPKKDVPATGATGRAHDLFIEPGLQGGNPAIQTQETSLDIGNLRPSGQPPSAVIATGPGSSTISEPEPSYGSAPFNH